MSSSSQFNPWIYEDLVVWQDTRNGNDDIYLYNITSGEERRITTDPSNQRNPRIWGDRIVWEDYRNGNPEIYMYTISTGEEEALPMTRRSIAHLQSGVTGLSGKTTGTGMPISTCTR